MVGTASDACNVHAAHGEDMPACVMADTIVPGAAGARVPGRIDADGEQATQPRMCGVPQRTMAGSAAAFGPVRVAGHRHGPSGNGRRTLRQGVDPDGEQFTATF